MACEIIASTVAVLGVTAIAWFYSQQRRRYRLTDDNRDWINEALVSIKRAAAAKLADSNATPAIEVTSIIARLRSLCEGQAGAVASSAMELEQAWDDLMGLDPQDSSLANRVTALTRRINVLADDILQEID